MPIRVASKYIIFTTAVLSSAISLAAGYLLYLESIAVLRSAVEDSSSVVSNSAKLQLADMLADAVRNAESTIVMLGNEQVFNITQGMEAARTVYLAHAFAALQMSKLNSGGGYLLSRIHNESCDHCTPPWEDPDGFTRQYVFYDYNIHTEAKQWLTTGTTRENDTAQWAFTMSLLDKTTGATTTEVFRREEPPERQQWWAEQYMHGIPHEGKWEPVVFWSQVDGSPYSFSIFQKRVTLPWSLPDKYEVISSGFFVFDLWATVIRRYESNHTELLVLDSNTGGVYAHTLYLAPSIKYECYNECFSCSDFGGRDCLLHSTDLGPTVSAAVNASTMRQTGVFFSADLPSTSISTHVQHVKQDYFVETNLKGGEYFIRTTHVFNATTMDFNLLWMRSVASVNDKVFAALVRLVVASVIIFTTDILITALELILIARPLQRLAAGTRLLKTMQLDSAEAHLNTIFKPIMLSEITDVADGTLLAIQGLRDYRAYLPDTLFAGVDSTDSSTVASKSKENCVQVMQSVAPQMQSHKGVVVRLEFVMPGNISIPRDFAVLVEVMHNAVQSTKGVAHGFAVTDPLSFTMTWNVAQRCPEPKIHAVSFCKIVSESMATAVATPVTAAVSGDIFAGNLGSSTHKGFGLTGPALHLLNGVAAVSVLVNKKLRRPVNLVSPIVAEGITGRYELTAVTLLTVDNDATLYVIREVGKELEHRHEEWMYQLQAIEEDPLADALHAVQRDSNCRPLVATVRDPTDIQFWVVENIRAGRTTITHKQAGTWV